MRLQCQEARTAPDKNERKNVITAGFQKSAPGKFALDKYV